MKISRLHLTYATIALLNAGDGTITTVFPPFLDVKGYTVSDIGFVVSVFSILSLISRVPSGLAYKPGRARQMMYVSAGVFAVTLPLYSVANQTIGLVAVRAISGFAFGAVTTVNLALFMDVLPSGTSRARAMAFYSAFMSGGYAIGNTFGGWLADSFGYESAFIAAAILPLLAAVFTPRVAEAASLRRKQSPPGGKSTTLWSRLSEVRNGPILSISQMAFTLNALHYIMSTYFPLYAISVGLSLTAVGLLRAVHSVFGMVTRPFSGEATRIASSDKLANGGLVMVALLVALIPSFSSMMVFIPLFMLLGTSRGVVMVSNTINLVNEVGDDADRRGVVSGIFNAAKDLGNIGGPILGGLIAAQTGIENMLRIGPAILLAAYFAILILAARARPKVVPMGASEGPTGDAL